MIKKYVYGNPFPTESVTADIAPEAGSPVYGSISLEEGFSFTYVMAEEDIVYGLGEANRGINKRGYIYLSDCADTPEHTEDLRAMYAAHNLLILDGKHAKVSGTDQAFPTQNSTAESCDTGGMTTEGKTAEGEKTGSAAEGIDVGGAAAKDEKAGSTAGGKVFGLYFDYPSTLTFDIGYTRQDTLTVSCADADLNLYVIDGDSPYDIVKQFRKIIGRSYIPPKFAFGYGQSRWGYRTREDFRNVAKGYRDNHIPLDMIYMDIEYMDQYMDFTLNEDFQDFPEFIKEMKEQHIRLIPIIDAGVKVKEGYDVYEDGVANNYFCKRADGSDFVAAVWPGDSHFPDVLNKDARKWFGDHYKMLTDMGIEGFWNDMNEPSIFYSTEGMAEAKKLAQDFIDSDTVQMYFLRMKLDSLANSHDDFKRFYHNVDGKQVCHEKVHNLYGYNMTRAADEAFERIDPDKRFLMFSRSSFVGMHRHGGVWTGDNRSWWAHILLNLKMLPSLNMCGFLYIGADLGGFGADTTRDLLLRHLALGVFTPLMRNHAAMGTREQECYQFENTEDFRSVIGVRYRLVPYLYSEYMKAALTDDLMFKPLAFVWPEDELAAHIEDQLVLGNEIMIAPVYEQNAPGRFVYLPERMKFVKFLPDGTIAQEVLDAGVHYVYVALNEVPLFIREGKAIPLAEAAESMDELDCEHLEMIGFSGSTYRLYDDDGVSKTYTPLEECKVLTLA